MLRRICRVGGREIVYRGNKCGGYREHILFRSSVQSTKSDSYERGDRYVVLEFDKNEVLIDALGGDLASPTWMFRAHLYVSSCSRLTATLADLEIHHGVQRCVSSFRRLHFCLPSNFSSRPRSISQRYGQRSVPRWSQVSTCIRREQANRSMVQSDEWIG